MTAARALVTALLLFTAVLIQTVIFGPLQLPGATPDVVLLVVVALALVQGEVSGLVAGFAGGLLLDLVPPADGEVGRHALVLCLIGLLAARLRGTAERSVFLPVLIVAGCSVLATLGYAATGWLLGDRGIDLGSLVASIAAAALYDVLLAPFVVPVVMWIAKRFEVSTAYARTRW